MSYAAGCCDTAEPLVPIGADAQVFYEGASTTTEGVTTYLNSGTVTYELADATGAVLDSGSLAYQPGSKGDYHATIDKTITVTLTEDSTYYLEITYTDAAGNDDFRRIKYVAGYRGMS
jgi:hypothetical protein